MAKKKSKEEMANYHTSTSALDLLLIRDRVLELWYTGGYTVEDIAKTVGTFINNVRRIIDDEENARKIPAVLKKAEQRPPKMYTVVDHDSGKLYYDITEYVLDTPGIYGDPTIGR